MIQLVEGYPVGQYKLSEEDLKELQEFYLPEMFDISEDDACYNTLRISKNRSERWNTDVDFGKFNDMIKPLVKNYIDSYMFQFPYEVSLQTWYNVHKKYDHQILHNHITTNVPAFSCVCILKQPNQNAGQLTFKTTNLSNHLKYLELDPHNRFPNVMQPNMEDGAFIIFPSCMEHYVTYNETNENRAVFATNIKVRRTDELF
jgi:hypothetical protein